MKVARADANDLQTTLDFLKVCEENLESGKFSFNNAFDNWEDLDDEDEDKIAILKLQKVLAEEEGVEVEELDNRILLYEWLSRKFKACSCNWRRVYWAADILLGCATDPTERCLEWAPGIEQLHVAPEQ